ncbi:adenosylmethionine--8-amino-7-oxononanoate transaminase [Deinococcus aquiradiocola]|uniref:Adenosylmethionine-8-amino-7-oxononanoate aminotransferase n=1 Tax=Deinococcus aquiradiocola TaxID=393059 RepID=A0A917PA05_9DEIO|nr:adenosylmethionine--8-amino-7-oxononanoate transaminase [Deinococcus aquiradiocola]GGJ68202.1 adenosylmethionine--8-amino-7-oxononanoate aminotransferase BioA [Deinococcus aquiradiocola]
MSAAPPTLLDLDARHVWHPFTQSRTAPTPTVIVRGEGAVLHAADGSQLLDMVSSWWVNLHGHAHPHIAQAIARQAGTLEHVIFAGFTHAPATHLAARLTAELPGLSRVFFSDNGSTAVEVALKIALQAHHNRGERRTRLLAFDGGYHGDTFGAMSAGATSGFYAPFQDKLFGVTFLPYPATWDGDEDVDAREAAALAALDAALGDDVSAILLEPLVQGSAGMRVTRPAFLNEVIRRVHASGALVILDEVMTGFGRTGELFAARHLQERPDLMCFSKGLTGGFLPMGLTAATEDLYLAFEGDTFDRAFAHGHSYTANPLACAAALASLDLTLSAETSAHWARIGARHAAARAELAAHPNVTHVRQVGTILAAEIRGAGEYGGNTSLELRQYFAARGLLMRPLGNVMYLLPPYVVTDEQLRQAYGAMLDAAGTYGRPA